MKGSKWGSRVVRNRVADGKVEVLCKLMREGLDQKLDLWLEIGHCQIFPIDRFLPTRGGTAELSCGVRRPILSCINKACAKGGRRAWHGGCFAREQCMWTHVCRRSHRSATRNPQLGGGRGLGGIPAEGRPHEQRPLFGRRQCACTGLAGGPWRPPSLPHWTQQDFSKSVKSPWFLKLVFSHFLLIDQRVISVVR